MAYINVFDWKCEQVSEWLKGKQEVNFKISKLMPKNYLQRNRNYEPKIFVSFF